MKDLYDFSKNEAEHNEFYARIREAYKRIFDRAGIGGITYLTFASGGIFSEFSEEFQTMSEAGEDTIYVDLKKGIALNKEVYTDENIEKLGLQKSDLVEKKSIEAGNIFHLGTKFSEPLDLIYNDENGNKQFVYMGSYGLGPTRLMGTIVEVLSDEKGIVWPKEISPFSVHLVRLGTNEETIAFADEVYAELRKKGVEVLYDDRDLRPGEKFADSDLIGIPLRFVISDKTTPNKQIEVKSRQSDGSELFSVEEAIEKIK